MDIALDPFPLPRWHDYCGSALDGRPRTDPNRQQFSVSSGRVGSAECWIQRLIAKDREDYIRKAKKFASDLQSLSETRHSLRRQVTESPLFDGSRFAEDFRAAAWGMWDSINK